MVSMAIDSVSALSSSVESAEGTEELLRKVFDAPNLQDLSRQKVEGIISEYGDGPTDDQHKNLVAALLALCVGVKGCCYLWCLHVSRTAKSEIAKTLGVDHRNDTISNIVVIMVIRIVAFLEARGSSSPWLSKIDPAATLLMSLWIIWCWVDTALEQVRLLSNRRVEDQEAVDKIAETAQQHLESTFMRLHRVDVYHCGESFEARLEVFPQSSAGASLSVDQISTALQELEAAVSNADVGVHKAHAKLRRPTNRDAVDASWVSGYTTP